MKSRGCTCASPSSASESRELWERQRSASAAATPQLCARASAGGLLLQRCRATLTSDRGDVIFATDQRVRGGTAFQQEQCGTEVSPSIPHSCHLLHPSNTPRSHQPAVFKPFAAWLQGADCGRSRALPMLQTTQRYVPRGTLDTAGKLWGPPDDGRGVPDPRGWWWWQHTARWGRSVWEGALSRRSWRNAAPTHRLRGELRAAPRRFGLPPRSAVVQPWRVVDYRPVDQAGCAASGTGRAQIGRGSRPRHHTPRMWREVGLLGEGGLSGVWWVIRHREIGWERETVSGDAQGPVPRRRS